MTGANLHIKKGAIFAYRLFDIAHEIDLKKVVSLFDPSKDQVRSFRLKKDPLKSITFRQAPIAISAENENIRINIKDQEKEFKTSLEIKVWDYGVISLCYKIELTDSLLWKDLVEIGSILDSDSIIDEWALKKKVEIVQKLSPALKLPHDYPLFEDYITYLIEEVEDSLALKDPKTGKTSLKSKKITDPLELTKKLSVAELLLSEPNRTISDATKKTVLSNIIQYTKKDLLAMDWNSAVVFDFTKEKEYQDYMDIIEFSIAQLLELRLYDQILDSKLDNLYASVQNKQYMKITDFYSSMAEESSQLYMEFSDVFEKIDNSIKTVGDFYLAKILNIAYQKFGFGELKRSVSRKIDTLENITKIYQDKINTLIDEERNHLAEKNTKTSHRLEWIIIILITIEVIPFLYNSFPKLIDMLGQLVGMS